MNIAKGKGVILKKTSSIFLISLEVHYYETRTTLLEIFRRKKCISNDKYTVLEKDAKGIVFMIKGLINSIPVRTK